MKGPKTCTEGLYLLAAWHTLCALHYVWAPSVLETARPECTAGLSFEYSAVVANEHN
jgi:hypothetical protein